MRVLPILSSTERSDCAYCTVDDNKITIWNCPEFPENTVILESMISGGSFREYLADSAAKFESVCLYLQPRAVRFLLPCTDGCGDELSCASLRALPSIFSEELMCNYIFSKHDLSVILLDDESTLKQKFETAEQCGVPFLIAASGLLEKIKTP